MEKDKIKLIKKALRKTNLPLESQEAIINKLIYHSDNPTTCYEGQKVMLDYERITSYQDWPRMRDEYKDFIISHKDDIFTVEFDEQKKLNGDSNYDSMVQLKEDTTKPKFLFWAGDLIPVTQKEKEKTELEKYMETVDAQIKSFQDGE